jgi:hypothetical protein
MGGATLAGIRSIGRSILTGSILTGSIVTGSHQHVVRVPGGAARTRPGQPDIRRDPTGHRPFEVGSVVGRARPGLGPRQRIHVDNVWCPPVHRPSAPYRSGPYGPPHHDARGAVGGHPGPSIGPARGATARFGTAGPAVVTASVRATQPAAVGPARRATAHIGTALRPAFDAAVCAAVDAAVRAAADTALPTAVRAAHAGAAHRTVSTGTGSVPYRRASSARVRAGRPDKAPSALRRR